MTPHDPRREHREQGTPTGHIPERVRPAPAVPTPVWPGDPLPDRTGLDHTVLCRDAVGRERALHLRRVGRALVLHLPPGESAALDPAALRHLLNHLPRSTP